MSYCRVLILICFSLFFFLFPPVLYASGIVINEFVSHPVSSQKEWVELYAKEGFAQAQYWIDDDDDFVLDTGNSKKHSVDITTTGSELHFFTIELSSSILNNSGDKIYLFDSNGLIIDYYIYASDPGSGIAIGRVPDGEGTFQLLSAASPGGQNSAPLPTPSSTPQPTVKPSKMPTTKPIPTVKSVNTENKIVLPTITPEKKILGNNTMSIKKNNVSTKSASNGAYPTAILKTSIEQKHKYLQVSPTNAIMVKSTAKAGSIMVLLGGLSLISCAILIFIKKWKRY